MDVMGTNGRKIRLIRLANVFLSYVTIPGKYFIHYIRRIDL